MKFLNFGLCSEYSLIYITGLKHIIFSERGDNLFTLLS